MPDFFQHAHLPTLHHLADSDLAQREAELAEWSKERPIALLLPALGAEFDKPALPRMLAEIAEVPYLSQVVLAVNQASEPKITEARQLCASLLKDKRWCILWNESPGLRRVQEQMKTRGLPEHRDGKGSNIWGGLVYLAAQKEHQIVASHDTDILSYERGMLWRLCYPVANPSFAYTFAKGYYGRVGARLYGRVTRLLVFPLIQAFIEAAGRCPLLNFLESFRYPLSGEFCAELNTLSRFHIPAGWGLEMCLLCESHTHLAEGQVCQVDLGFNFEHRHRAVSNASTTSALAEGLVDSASEVIRSLACHVLEEMPDQRYSLLNNVASIYPRIADQWVQRYEHDARFNGLNYDAADEHEAVKIFAGVLKEVLQGLDCATFDHDQHLTAVTFVEENADLAQAIIASAQSA